VLIILSKNVLQPNEFRGINTPGTGIFSSCRLAQQTMQRLQENVLHIQGVIMARTTFTGPVKSLNGFEGVFSSTSVQLQSNNSNSITIDAPNSLAASYSLVFPPNDGSANQVMTTDGSGVTTWTDKSANLVLPTSTAAAVGAIANAINTTGKYTGKMVVDYTTGIIYTATGAAAASDWAPSDASGLVTPA
jgi:hypothetical protein